MRGINQLNLPERGTEGLDRDGLSDTPAEPGGFGSRIASLLRRREQTEGERVAEKVGRDRARDRAAHDALAARDRAAGEVRILEQKLARARPALEAADAEVERVFPGSACPCSRCHAEVLGRSRGDLVGWRKQR